MYTLDRFFNKKMIMSYFDVNTRTGNFKSGRTGRQNCPLTLFLLGSIPWPASYHAMRHPNQAAPLRLRKMLPKCHRGLAGIPGKHLRINHFRAGSCCNSSCRGIHLPDGARHSALREAAVNTRRVSSLDGVHKVVRQEQFTAHRGRGRRGNDSERGG